MSEEETRQFLVALWAAQQQRAIKNGQLAAMLGCDPSYIRHLRRGRPGRGKRLGLSFVLRAVQHFPELARFLLPSELPGSNTVLPPSNEDSEV